MVKIEQMACPVEEILAFARVVVARIPLLYLKG